MPSYHPGLTLPGRRTPGPTSLDIVITPQDCETEMDTGMSTKDSSAARMKSWLQAAALSMHCRQTTAETASVLAGMMGRD
jgi:hypothetical protein